MEKRIQLRAYLAAFTLLCSFIFGCATQDSVESLDKRITTLEQKEKSKDTAREARQTELETCVNVTADYEYWEYIRLNGKPVAGKPGTYTAPQYVWNNAEKEKKDKIEECKLLYGPR